MTNSTAKGWEREDQNSKTWLSGGKHAGEGNRQAGKTGGSQKVLLAKFQWSQSVTSDTPEKIDNPTGRFSGSTGRKGAFPIPVSPWTGRRFGKRSGGSWRKTLPTLTSRTSPTASCVWASSHAWRWRYETSKPVARSTGFFRRSAGCWRRECLEKLRKAELDLTEERRRARKWMEYGSPDYTSAEFRKGCHS